MHSNFSVAIEAKTMRVTLPPNRERGAITISCMVLHPLSAPLLAKIICVLADSVNHGQLHLPCVALQWKISKMQKVIQCDLWMHFSSSFPHLYTPP